MKGNLASSTLLDTVGLTDPLILLQSLAAGHAPLAAALSGAAIVLVFYVVLGGRVYCSWVCPINAVADAAAWMRQRLRIGPGWQPRRALRYWILATTLAVSALTGTIAWELVNHHLSAPGSRVRPRVGLANRARGIPVRSAGESPRVVQPLVSGLGVLWRRRSCFPPAGERPQ